MRDIYELNINNMGQAVSRTPPTQSEFVELESTLGAKLPMAYKTLLGIANGGHPELNSFVPENSSAESRWSIDIFYHLTLDRTSQGSVWRALQDYGTILGRGRLPIACDEGGNQIVLDLRDSPSSVKLVIHDEGFRELLVAQSLDIFLSLLCVDPDMI